MTIREQILAALEEGPLHCGAVAREVGLDAAPTRDWLKMLIEDGDVVELSGFRYALAESGRAA